MGDKGFEADFTLDSEAYRESVITRFEWDVHVGVGWKFWLISSRCTWYLPYLQKSHRGTHGLHLRCICNL